MRSLIGTMLLFLVHTPTARPLDGAPSSKLPASGLSKKESVSARPEISATIVPGSILPLRAEGNVTNRLNASVQAATTDAPAKRKVAKPKAKATKGKPSKASTKARRPKPRRAPEPSLWTQMSARVAAARADVESMYEERQARLREERVRREAEQALREAELRERIKQMREEAARLQAENGGAGGAGAEEEEVEELTLSERGALIGSVLLSPSGIAGVVVGGAVGGMAGYVVDQVEKVGSYLAGSYAERVRTEREVAEQIEETSETLQASSPSTSPLARHKPT